MSEEKKKTVSVILGKKSLANFLLNTEGKTSGSRLGQKKKPNRSRISPGRGTTALLGKKTHHSKKKDF